MNYEIGNYDVLINKYCKGLTQNDLEKMNNDYHDIYEKNNFNADMSDEELVSRARVIWGDFFNIIFHTQLLEQIGFKFVLELKRGNILLYAWNGEKALDDFGAWKFGFILPTYLLEPRQVNLIVDAINENWTATLGKIPYRNNVPRLIEDKKVGVNEFVYDKNKPYERFELDSGDEQLYDKIFSFTEKWIDSVKERPDIGNLSWVHIYSSVQDTGKKIKICYEGYNSYPPEMVLTFDASNLTTEEYIRLGREIYKRLGENIRGEYLTFSEHDFELLKDDVKKSL